jgi:hypothetical protein
MLTSYNLFVSHSWKYSDAYEKLIKLIEGRGYFNYRNYSIPKDDPLENPSESDKKLASAIRDQMQHCSVVLVLAGVYASYSKWIDKEIKIAKELKKPIIAIEPWGSEKTSKKVKENANKIVKWQANSIVDAIRNC